MLTVDAVWVLTISLFKIISNITSFLPTKNLIVNNNYIATCSSVNKEKEKKALLKESFCVRDKKSDKI